MLQMDRFVTKLVPFQILIYFFLHYSGVWVFLNVMPFLSIVWRYQIRQTEVSLTAIHNGRVCCFASFTLRCSDTPLSVSAHSYITVVATYSCFPGFSLSNNLNRTCAPLNATNGTWPGTAPTCDAIADYCPQLLPPSSGHVVVPSRKIYDNATFSCDSGYKLVGT
jgi:hypothetical protein